MPRDYSRTLPKQIRQLARRSALSYKAKSSSIKIVEDFTLDQPKTRELAAILKALQLSGRKTLLVVPSTDRMVWKSGRNIPHLHVIEASKASTYEILDSQVLLIQKSAVGLIEKAFG